MFSNKARQQSAQTMMEYLLVMVVVAAVVFGAFTLPKGGIADKIREAANLYFDTGAAAIMGGYYEPGAGTSSGRYAQVNPKAINGKWCSWTMGVNGFKSRECACPRPAFGGLACDGNAVALSADVAASLPGSGCPVAASVACGQSLGYDAWGSPCPGVGLAQTCVTADPCLNVSCNSSGACVTSSKPGTTVCGTAGCSGTTAVARQCVSGSCQDVPSVCGTGGNPCLDATCSAGTCGTTSKANGASCGNNLQCQDGVCKPSCALPLIYKGGSCVTPTCGELLTAMGLPDAGQGCCPGGCNTTLAGAYVTSDCDFCCSSTAGQTPAQVCAVPSCGQLLHHQDLPDNGLGCCTGGCKTTLAGGPGSTWDCSYCCSSTVGQPQDDVCVW